MKLAEEFRQHAAEWRQIGNIAATDEHRRRIAEIADTWLAWAERRERMLRAENRKARKLSGRSVRAAALVVTLALLAPLPARSQQPTFNPATFDWTDPANWSTTIDPSGVQKWTLRDPAARDYRNQAVRAGQFCVASFRRGSRNVNLMIPKISPECQRRGG